MVDAGGAQEGSGDDTIGGESVVEIIDFIIGDVVWIRRAWKRLR